MSFEESAKKICVVTGTRAEYGLLSGVMHEIVQNSVLSLQVIACAAHLSQDYGMTVNQIIADGFVVDERVEMLETGDTTITMAKSVARGITGFVEAFERLQPDCILVLGDRYEILAAAQTAMLMNIPIAHIHGGEVTLGAVDDSIRHAITKMANLHFVAAEPYRNRVIQMGEQPNRVFNVGAPGIDYIEKIQYLSQPALEGFLELNLSSPLFVVTFHPVTLDVNKGQESLQNLFSTLEKFPEATIIWTGTNADAQGHLYNYLIQNWIAQTDLNIKFVQSLGSIRYLSLMKLASLVIGNSSSGIIEAPAMGVATVNIGNRQAGRLMANSIFSADESIESIGQTIQAAMEFEDPVNSLYGKGDSAKSIAEILAQTDLSDLNNKVFYDVKEMDMYH